MVLQKITMPQLGESVTEGTIERWLVKEGDYVNKYDPIAEVNTDKVNAEIPSSYSGTIQQLIATEGAIVDVGEVVCFIETDEGQVVVKEVPDVDESIVSKKENKATKPSSSKGRFSPAVLRLATNHQIELDKVSGTGAGGRITRKDLLAYIEKEQQAPTQDQAVQPLPSPRANPVPTLIEPEVGPIKAVKPTQGPGDVEIPVSPVRRTIANNMVQSKFEIPHAWMMVEVDVTRLVKYRDSLKEEFKREEGFNLTYFAFFVKAVSTALKEFPLLNSTWADDVIIHRKEINISIPVAVGNVLFVPVIRRADEKTIKAIGREIVDLARQAREGKLTPSDMEGGTFTVNNTGSFGSVQSMGIINYPQAALLQVESIVKRPVIMEDDMIGIRHMVNLCLSLDHRVLDGLICGQFLARVKELLENMTAESTPIY